MEFIEPYKLTVLVLGLSGFMFWLQLVITDAVGIATKHTPGYSIEQNHDSFLFRSDRVFANSNETVGILVLFALFAILSSANANWLNGFSLAYLCGRMGHMICYYTNLKTLRSVSFVISFISLLGMFVVGLLSWL